MSIADGVFVNFESVFAIFQIVAIAFDLRRKLFRFSNRYKTGAQVVGQGWGKDESARFDANDMVNLSSAKMLGRLVNHSAQTGCIFEQCSDVVKKYPGFGKIWNFSNECFQFL